MTSRLHPLMRAALSPWAPPETLTMDHPTELRTVTAQDLQPGDEILDTAIGGHSGLVQSVRVYPEDVHVRFSEPGRGASMSGWEICSIRRRR